MPDKVKPYVFPSYTPDQKKFINAFRNITKTLAIRVDDIMNLEKQVKELTAQRDDLAKLAYKTACTQTYEGGKVENGISLDMVGVLWELMEESRKILETTIAEEIAATAKEKRIACPHTPSEPYTR